jgi:hypothetical protein
MLRSASLGLLLALFLLGLELPAYATTCSAEYGVCHTNATSDRSLCNNQCDSTYPLGQERTDCRNGCTATYNVKEGACTGERSNCLVGRQSNCNGYVCPAHCGANNDVVFCQYNDTSEQCDYYCECTGPRPSCPGSAACNSGQWQCDTPILVDVAGNGFRLCSAADGVDFDLAGTGTPQHLAWTEADSDDGWLVLDRDGSGAIESGRELFGNFTAQPMPPAGHGRNGFLALAVFDQAPEGGNANGYIDAGDAVYPSLRIWGDINHNGVTDGGELKTLIEANIGRIELQYKVKHRVDAHGNAFYYRARAFDLGGNHYEGKFVWDVFLTSTP